MPTKNPEPTADPVAEPVRRLVWVVKYPAISVQPKDSGGEPVGEPVVLREGDTLPADCEWTAGFLRNIGHVVPLSVALP